MIDDPIMGSLQVRASIEANWACTQQGSKDVTGDAG